MARQIIRFMGAKRLQIKNNNKKNLYKLCALSERNIFIRRVRTSIGTILVLGAKYI